MIPRAGMQSQESAPATLEPKQNEELNSSIQIHFLHKECDDGFLAIDIADESDEEKTDVAAIPISDSAKNNTIEATPNLIPLYYPPVQSSPSLDDTIGQIQDHLIDNIGKLIGAAKPKQFAPTLESLPEHDLHIENDSTVNANTIRKRTPSQVEEEDTEHTPLIASPPASPKNQDSICPMVSNFSFSRFRSTLFGNNCLQTVGKFFEDCLRPAPDLDNDNVVNINEDDMHDVLALNYILYRPY